VSSKCSGKRREWMPRLIQVGGRKYAVQWLTDAQAQAVGSIGCHHYDQGWMRFDDTLDDEMLATVTLHEIAHAVYMQFMPSTIKDEVEEDFVEMFSTGLAAAIHQNPKLFKRIIKKLR